MLGVVAATVIFEMLRQPLMAIYTSRVVGLPVYAYLYAAYARPVAVMIAVAAMAWALQVLLQPHSLIILFAAAALSGGWWVALTWYVGLEPADRTRIRHLVAMGWSSMSDLLTGGKAVDKPAAES